MTDKCLCKGKKLSGAVLIMVITVMFMLIIMLLATLTVVSTAQNRAYTKFEENQAYYTARSALDVYTGSLLSDGAQNVQGASYRYTDDTGMVQTTNLTQGLSLELELYKIKAQNSSMIWANPVKGDGTFTSSSPEESNYAIDNANPVDYIEYTVEFPALKSTSGGTTTNYGKFVDTDSSGKQIAKIKVEVLERVFNMNPTYTDDQLAHMDDAAYAGAPTTAQVKAAIAAGNRSKDRMKIKVTSTVEFMGVTGTASVIFDTTEPVAVVSGNAMTSMGGIQLNNLTILGGAATRTDSAPANMGKIYGGIFAESKFHNGNGGSSVPMTEDEVIYIGGDFSWENNVQFETYNITGTKNRPLVYVNGVTGSSSNKMEFGSATQSIDLVTNGLTISGNGGTLYGNLYCIGDVDLSQSGQDPAFKIEGTGNNAFVKGDLICDDKGMTGNYYVNGNIIITNSAWVMYDTVTGVYSLSPTGIANLTNCRWAGNVQYRDPASVFHNVTVTLPNTTSFASGAWDDLELDATELASKDDVEICLLKLNGTNVESDTGSTGKRNVPTSLGEYYNYYKKDSSGNLVITGNPAPNDYEIITAEEWAGTPNEADRNAGNYTIKDFTAPASAIVLMPRSNRNGLNVGGTDQSSYELNSASSADYLLKSSGTDRNNGYGDTSNIMRLTGGGTFNFYLEQNGSYGGIIVVDDDTTLNIYAPKGGTYNWEMEIYTEQVYDYTKSSPVTPLAFGEGGNVSVPKINIYIASDPDDPATTAVDERTVWNVSSASKHVTVGYVYAPHALVKANVGALNSAWTYDGLASGSTSFSFIGSLIAGEISMGSNHTGVAYVDPDSSSYIPGKPMFAWDAYQYTR